MNVPIFFPPYICKSYKQSTFYANISLSVFFFYPSFVIFRDSKLFHLSFSVNTLFRNYWKVIFRPTYEHILLKLKFRSANLKICHQFNRCGWCLGLISDRNVDVSFKAKYTFILAQKCTHDSYCVNTCLVLVKKKKWMTDFFCCHVSIWHEARGKFLHSVVYNIQLNEKYLLASLITYISLFQTTVSVARLKFYF